MRNITVQEFQATVTTRVLLDRLVDQGVLRTKFRYDDALSQSIYACNDVFTAIGINSELWARIRGKRAYVFHEPTNRIAAELGVLTDDAGDGRRCNLRIELIGKRGKALPITIGDIAVETGKLGHSGYSRKGKLIRPKEVRHG